MKKTMQFIFRIFLVVVVIFAFGSDISLKHQREEKLGKNVVIKDDLPGRMDFLIDSIFKESNNRYDKLTVVYGKAQTGVVECVDSVHGINLISLSRDSLLIMPENATTFPGGAQVTDLVQALKKILNN